MTRRTAASILIRIPVTLALAGVLGIALVRLAPGFGVDERELDARFDSTAIASMRVSGSTVALPGWKQLWAGEWGTSQTFGVPVRQLLAERWPVTLRSILAGLALAWVAALALAAAGTLVRWLDWAGSVASFGMLSLPAGLVAIAVFLAGLPVAIGIAVAVFPQVFRYARQLALDAMAQPCVFSAAARGVHRVQVLVRHAGALAAPQLISLLGASMATAVGAAIPMEALCDSPGLGQLAWKAALARDLQLLVPLILLITLLIQLANVCAELAQGGEAAAEC